MEHPLSEALSQGNIEETERLLKKWNVNKELSTGETPLHRAIRGKNSRKSDMIRFLIEKCNADVNYKGSSKWTPLHRALNCDAGKDVVEMLVTAKAEISPLGATWQKFVHLEQWLTRYLVCTTDVERAMISKSFVVFSASTNPSHNTPSETLSDKKSVSGSTNPTSSTPSESETLISSLDKKSSSIEVNHVLGVLMTFEGKWQTWRLTAVHREGSMGKAGLLKDDRIKSINEQLVTKANLQAVLERAASDDRGIYTVNIFRGKNSMDFKVTSMPGASAILGPRDVKTEKKLSSSTQKTQEMEQIQQLRQRALEAERIAHELRGAYEQLKSDRQAEIAQLKHRLDIRSAAVSQDQAVLMEWRLLNLQASVFQHLADFVNEDFLDDWIGQVSLAKGGFGEIQKGLFRGQVCVLKTIKSSGSETTESSYKQKCFEWEVQALLILRHPSIVKLKAVVYKMGDEKDSVHGMFLEFIDGVTLKDRLKEQSTRPISDQQRLWFMWDIASIMASVHGQGWYHRDLKPANLMVVKSAHESITETLISETFTPTSPSSSSLSSTSTTSTYPSPIREEVKVIKEIERLKLIDFGLARLHHEDGGTDHPTAGTKEYQAPEIRANPSDPSGAPSGLPSPKVDVYAFGKISHELLSGNQFAPKMQKELEQLIQECLVNEPRNRPSFAAIVKQLEILGWSK